MNCPVHRYPVFKRPKDSADAVKIQKTLKSQIRLVDAKVGQEYIAGIDVGYAPKLGLSKAAVAVFSVKNHRLIETAIAYDETEFPYISGLLSFREMPVILKALSVLKIRPDILMVDGQGIAHPRQMGIATHLGLHTNIPSMGIAKTRLWGQYDNVGESKGDASRLTNKSDHIGWVLRSREGVKPIFVSPGHMMSCDKAKDLALSWLDKYKLPVPTYTADKISKF